MAKAGIVYVGTDHGLVIYSDPGESGRWRRIGHDLKDHRIEAIIVAEAEEGNVAVLVSAAGSDALFSLDGGQSWGVAPAADAETLRNLRESKRPLIATSQGLAQWTGAHPPAPGADALAMLAGKQETLLAAIADGTTLLRSEDGGANWQPVSFATPLAGAITVLAPSSYHMDICWAGTSTGQLLRSDDRGGNWVEIAREPTPIRSIAMIRII